MCIHNHYIHILLCVYIYIYIYIHDPIIQTTVISHEFPLSLSRGVFKGLSTAAHPTRSTNFRWQRQLQSVDEKQVCTAAVRWLVENGPFMDELAMNNMVIFHIYVSLPQNEKPSVNKHR